jgi:hypothetical protein
MDGIFLSDGYLIGQKFVDFLEGAFVEIQDRIEPEGHPNQLDKQNIGRMPLLDMSQLVPDQHIGAGPPIRMVQDHIPTKRKGGNRIIGELNEMQPLPRFDGTCPNEGKNGA